MAVGSVRLEAAVWLVYALAAAQTMLWIPGTRMAFKARALSSWRTLSWEAAIAWAVLLFVLGTWVVLLRAPVTGWDAAVAHLALAKDYIREGRIGLMPGNSYSAFPQLMQALYTIALFHGGEWSASMVNWIFGALACLAACVLARRMAGEVAGYVAAAATAAMPVFVSQLSAPGVDLPFAAVVLCGLAAWICADQENRPEWLAVSGALLGSSFGIRHTGLYAAALMVIVVLLARSPGRIRWTVIVVLAVGAGALPWLVRSFWLTGNPVYPFLASWMPSEGLPSDELARVGAHESVRGGNPLAALVFYGNVILFPHHYDGWMQSPGMVPLVLGLPGLLLAGRYGRWMGAFSIAGVTGLFFFRQFARYLFPFYLPMMPVGGAVVSHKGRFRPWALLLIGVSYVVGVTMTMAFASVKAPVACGWISKQGYLQSRVERYAAFQWVNENLPHDAMVLMIDPRAYYVDRRTVSDFEMIKALVPLDDRSRLDWLRDKGITHVLHARRYAEESPGFRETGVLGVIEKWRGDSSHFEIVYRENVPTTRNSGSDVVEIYRVKGLGESSGVH
ncbi:MAG: hypothetical protein AMXMBFR84_03200 [Candidatus Hydrogenedentota bacterium]